MMVSDNSPSIRRHAGRLARTLVRLAGAALLSCTATHVQASSGIDSLNYFFDQIKSFEAAFGQEVLDETMDSLDHGKGKVWIKRPGLFRWDYEPPEAQEIVGDGDRVWIYDIELEQVTVRNQQQALGRTPAILLAGSGDLEQNYTVIDIGTQGRFDWVNLIPLDEESGFTEIRIGFEDNRLRLMELLDNLGQRTRMSFVDLKENQPISDSIFNFVPPPGVDVIDESDL
jgi:outer membrane lipoprotein carrier protein